jgi:hypothetical protein
VPRLVGVDPFKSHKKTPMTVCVHSTEHKQTWTVA